MPKTAMDFLLAGPRAPAAARVANRRRAGAAAPDKAMRKILLGAAAIVPLAGCVTGGSTIWAWENAGVPHYQAENWAVVTGLEPAQARGWIAAGITSPQDVRAWIGVGITDPAEAVAWQQLMPANSYVGGYGVTSAGRLKAAGMTPAETQPYVAAGLTMDNPEQILAAQDLHAHGLSYARAIYYVRNGVKYADIGDYDRKIAAFNAERQEYQRRRQAAVQGACGARPVASPLALAELSPYAVQGRCFVLGGIGIFGICQWVSSTVALVDRCNMMIEFQNAPDNVMTLMVTPFLVIGEEPFVYTAVLGNMRTIPSVRVIMQLDPRFEGAPLPLPPT